MPKRIRRKPNTASLPEIMTPGEVAKLFHITADAINAPRWDARLKPFRTGGGHRRYRRGPVAAYMEQQAARRVR